MVLETATMSCRTKWLFWSMIIGSVQLDVDGSSCGRRDKVQMTVMSIKPRQSESTGVPLPHYECYLSSRDGDASVVAKRPYNTGHPTDNPQPSSVTVIDDLPTGTAGHNVSLDTSDNHAFGAYYCTAMKEGKQTTSITTIFMHSNSYATPGDQLFTQTLNIGDRVDIDIQYSGTSSADILWRVNGSKPRSDSLSGGDYARDGARENDNGLYEFLRAFNRDGFHCLRRLIVRSCIAGKWGPPGCTGICDNCYNGGVCDDETGRCICPPGFMGINCLTACGSNRFGYLCEFECSSGGDGNPCMGKQFCLLDPFGCRCNTGFHGLGCDQECTSGTFGAGCNQICHCSSGNCDRFTGVCEYTICANGWSGANCQIPDVCPDGYYGENCTEKCLCHNDVANCHKTTGVCPDEQCAPGSMLNHATRRCEVCPDGYYGDSCMEKCHCEADACDKVTGECVGCCKHQWVDVPGQRCQQGFMESESLIINPGQPPKVNCTYIRAASMTWLTVGLSRSADSYEGVFVEDEVLADSSTIHNDFRQLTYVFTLPGSNSSDAFYCQLLNSQRTYVHAWVKTTYIIGDLPVLTTAPVIVFSNQTSVTISWAAWNRETDVGDPPVVAYVPYHRRSISDEWINGSAVNFNETLEYTVYGLGVDTEYEFAVSAVREGQGGEGSRSIPLVTKTPCYVPTVVPTDVMVALIGSKALNVSWKINTDDVKCSSFSYTIYYTTEGSSDTTKSVPVDGDKSWIIISEDLEPQQSYSFQVSLTTDNKFEGPRSETSNMVTLPGKKDIPLISPAIYIPVIVAVLLIVIIIVIVLNRRRKKNKLPASPSMAFTNSVPVNVDGAVFQHESNAAGCAKTKGGPVNIYEVSGITEEKPLPLTAREESRPTNTTPTGKPVISHRSTNKEDKLDEACSEMPPGDVYQNVRMSIPVSNLPLYFSKNRDDIQNEFQRLKKGQQFPWTVGAKQENSKKNRFRQMFTYDHSRVVLGQVPDDDHSDYYNASYILDQNGKKSFIASQAPNTASINFFWVMIWQEEVSTIVMLTNLIENGKDRCYQYWPNNEGDSKMFGSYVVSWAETTHFANFDVRKLQVSLANEVRTLYQFHYTTWPDMDVPEPGPLMEFVKHVKLRQGKGRAPVFTHCSAGVGRTGTFIALYCLMEVIKTEKTINIFDFVEKARENRINMVQTEIQYVFIYRCLVNYCLTRHTEIPSGLLVRFDIGSKRDTLTEEFKLLSSFQDKDALTVYENPQERQKTRFPDVAPSMSGRIYLASTASNGNSNFINATLFTSLMKKNAYISTQSPLPDTVEDFWRLVYDWKCSTIVMLNQLDKNDETCVKYWPDDGSVQYGNMSVAFTESKKHTTHIHRQFEVAHIKQQGTLTVHQLQLLSWPTGPDFTTVRELKKSMTFIEDDTKTVTLVHCIDGAGRSGVFVAVETALEPVSITSNVDVFNTVREMRQRNSHVVSTQEDYTLCYRIIKSLLSADGTYENFGEMSMQEESIYD